MYSLVFVVLALQPSETWGQIGVTGQFFALLGLAFAMGSLPFFMLKTGIGNSQLFPKSTPKEPQKGPATTVSKVLAESPELWSMCARSF